MPPALLVGRPRLQRHQMIVIQPQLGGIFDGDNALAIWDFIGQDVQQGRLARACPARHDEVLAHLHAQREKLRHRVAQRCRRNQIGHFGTPLRELPYRQAGAFHRHGRNDGVHPRPIWQARIHHWRAFVDTAAQRRDNAFDHPAHRLFAGEYHRMPPQPSAALDIDLVIAVDHDFGNFWRGQQRFEGTQTDGLVQHLLAQRRPVRLRRHVNIGRDDMREQPLGFSTQRVIAHASHIAPAQIQRFQQRRMQTTPFVQPLRRH